MKKQLDQQVKATKQLIDNTRCACWPLECET